MSLLKRITILKLDLIITDDKFIQNKIDIAQEEFDALQKEILGGSDNTSDALIWLSERTKYLVMETTITAKRFFEMIKYYNKKG